MVQFGENLGKHDRLTQQKQIMLALTHLEREEEGARDKQKGYEKMVKSLGVSRIAVHHFAFVMMGGKVMGIDVDVIFKIAGIGIVVAFLHTILDQVGKKEYAQWVTLFGFIYILFMVVSIVDDLFQKIRSVFLFQ